MDSRFLEINGGYFRADHIWKMANELYSRDFIRFKFIQVTRFVRKVRKIISDDSTLLLLSPGSDAAVESPIFFGREGV